MQIEKDKYEKIYSTNFRYPNSGELYGSLNNGLNIIDYVNSLEFETVLDIGCGRGQMAKLLHDKEKIVSACDISESVIAQNNQTYTGIIFKSGGMDNIPFDEKFDLVTSFEVLEHIPEPELDKSFDELIRVAKKDILLSAAWHSDIKCGVELHVTIHPKEWWIDRLSRKFSTVKVVKEKQFNMFMHVTV